MMCFKKKLMIWGLVLMPVLVGISGCGGGGSSQESVASMAAGVLVDPYIAGAVLQETSAGGGATLQESSPSDQNGNFTFEKNLTPGSIVQIKPGFGGQHNGLPFSGTLKRVVDQTGYLVVSPLTTLMANGLTEKEIVEILVEAGISGFQVSHIRTDPIAGLFDLTAVNAEDLIPLQAAMAVNFFLSLQGDYHMGYEAVNSRRVQLAVMVALVKDVVSKAAFDTILQKNQIQLSGLDVDTGALTLEPLIFAAVNIAETVVSRVKSDPALDLITEATVYKVGFPDLVKAYYSQQNRGVAEVEAAIAAGLLPDLSANSVPALDVNGHLIPMGGGVDSLPTIPAASNPSGLRPDGKLAVFPSAQGYGTETPAGRGGQVLKVTNLNNSGAGSLRAALEASGPRTIVFEVSGAITLTDNLIVSSPFVTIAGQTAPSPGIMLKGAGLSIETHDVLLQHLRIRTGDLPEGPSPVDNRDGLSVWSWTPDVYNVVIDHVSVSWATDENMGPYSRGYDLEKITISNSIISESMTYGMLIGGGCQNISLVGNLMAHNMDRNPLIKAGASAEVVNNVMYNHSQYAFTSIGSNDEGYGPAFVNMVGNVYIAGPNTAAGVSAVKVEKTAPAGTQVYLSDNKYTGTVFTYSTSFNPQVASPALPLSTSEIRPSSTVEAAVLGSAGARPADRDSVDSRVVREVKTRTGKLIRSQKDVAGWPTLAKNSRAFSVANPSGDDDGDGYTNLEEVLQQMAAQVEGK